MEITPQIFLAFIACLGLILSVIGWFMRLEFRLNQKMSREEHTDICDRKHKEIMEKIKDMHAALDVLRNSIEAKEAYSSQQRHKMRELLQGIEIKLAVITREMPHRKSDDA